MAEQRVSPDTSRDKGSRDCFAVRGMNLTRENGRIELSPGEVFECLHEQVNGVKDDVPETSQGASSLKIFERLV